MQVKFKLNVMSKQKYYVVWKGNNPGVYKSWEKCQDCLLYTSPSPRDDPLSRMPSSA